MFNKFIFIFYVNTYFGLKLMIYINDIKHCVNSIINEV